MVAEACHPTEVAQMRGLHARGVDVHAAVAPGSPHAGEIEALGIPVETILFRGHMDWSAVHRLRQLIRQWDTQIVHGLANRPISNLFWASLGLPVKLIAYRGTCGHVHRLDPGSWLKWYNPRIDQIICVSEAVQQSLMKAGIAPNRLTTIHKGHDLTWYDGLPRCDLAEFGIPPDALVVGLSANMRPVKGADVLVRAIAELDSSLSVHALLIGEVRDSRIPQIIKDKKLEDRVHLVGFRNDAPALIGSCDVLTAPSRDREGLTKAVIEAMAQARPVIVSAAGGLPEMVDDGRSGYVVPVDDPGALAARIRELAADPALRKEMGRRARELVVERFGVDRTVEKTLALYCRLLGETRPG